jgi:hypothetical protein
MIKSIPSKILIALLVCLVTQNCFATVPENNEAEEGYELSIVYPTEETELVGGQNFRTTLFLTDYSNQPIEGASLEAELWTPDGDLFQSLNFTDKNGGRYLADSVTLPLRNSQGIWQVTARAVIGNDVIAQRSWQFISQQSYNEQIQDLFGFWIDLSDLFSYNVPNAEDPQLKTYSYDNGGYLILANNLRPGGLDSPFVILDVHWRFEKFPDDQNTAKDYVISLAGPHGITLDLSPAELYASQDSFLDWPAWHVTGVWNRYDALGNPIQDAPLDWMIFNCPGSDWLWTILFTSNDGKFRDDPELIRQTYSCS